jgi:type I restriction enzyme, S subunit
LEKLKVMAVWNTINLTDIKPDRCDAEYFRKDYKENLELLNKTGATTSLGSLFKKIERGEKPEYQEVGPIPVLRSVNIRALGFNDTRQEYVTEDFYNAKPRGQVLKDDILFTCTGTGTLGRTSIWYKDSKAFNVPENSFLRDPIGVDPYLIAAYFNTPYGREQLFQHQRGSSGQLHLYPVDIRRMIVPECLFPFQQEIGDYLRKAFDLQQESQTLYQKATDLLEKELSLDKITFETPKSYTASFSEVLGFSRIDGEHFQPKFRKIREIIENYQNGFERLSSNIKVVKPDYQLKNHPRNKIQYIELSNINPSMGYIDKIEEMDVKKAPSRAKRMVFTGDVIASSVVGSVDKAGLVSEIENGHIASNGFFQFRSDYYSPEFLLVLIKSNFVKEQFHQQSTGGILSAVPDQNLKYIIIPKIDVALQNQITELVRESHVKVRESKKLLEQAKNRVEELIEEAAENNN